MQRVIAGLPESLEGLCLVRFGVIARRWTAWGFVRGMGKAIDREASAARGSGLLHAERLALGFGHVGALQYWRSFGELDAWSHRAPHAEWWRRAVDRMRRRGDLGVYHEAYLVPRSGVESIYLDCPPLGLAAFGTLGEPVGSQTTARQRMGNRGRSASGDGSDMMV